MSLSVSRKGDLRRKKEGREKSKIGVEKAKKETDTENIAGLRKEK